MHALLCRYGDTSRVLTSQPTHMLVPGLIPSACSLDQCKPLDSTSATLCPRKSRHPEAVLGLLSHSWDKSQPGLISPPIFLHSQDKKSGYIRFQDAAMATTVLEEFAGLAEDDRKVAGCKGALRSVEGDEELQYHKRVSHQLRRARSQLSVYLLQ